MRLRDGTVIAFYALAAVSFAASVIVTALNGAPWVNVAIPAAGLALTSTLAVTKYRSIRKQQTEADAGTLKP